MRNTDDLSDSVCVSHEPCPECGSRDNLGRYSDGHGYCFGCGYYEKAETMEAAEYVGEDLGFTSVSSEASAIKETIFTKGEIKALTKRGISKETCSKFDYRVGNYLGRTCQVANYRENNSITAQKMRFPDKTFQWNGSSRDLGLYGQWLWRDGGKMVIVTEGEIDALSVSQVQGNKWPVVSVKNGAQGAKKDVQKSLEWLESYETVVFMFDMDEPGQEAARACASILTPGKAKVARLPLKDANEMLMSGRVKELLNAIWEAKTYRPDGIVAGQDIWDAVRVDEVVESVDYPFPSMNKKTHGLRKGELTTITAGSGVGKSALVREIGYDLLQRGEKVGFIMLEESVKRTALGLMGLALDKPLHLGGHGVAEDKLRTAFDLSLIHI